MPCGAKEGAEKKSSLSQYISRDYSLRVSPRIDTGYLPGRAMSTAIQMIQSFSRPATTATGPLFIPIYETFAYDESETITIQSLWLASFASYHLPRVFRFTYTATAIARRRCTTHHRLLSTSSGYCQLLPVYLVFLSTDAPRLLHFNPAIISAVYSARVNILAMKSITCTLKCVVSSALTNLTSNTRRITCILTYCYKTKGQL